MKRLVPMLMAVALAACGGDMSENSTVNPPAAMPAAKTSFTAFTETLIHNQSETEEPLAVAPKDFYFPDDDNEAAFVAVVPAV